jgi:HEAT repeat protein
MKRIILNLATLLVFAIVNPLRGETTGDSSAIRLQPKKVAEQMRGFNMQPGTPLLDDGKVNPKEQHRQEIIKRFRLIGKEAIPALIDVLKDPDVQMRRNAELALISLAGGYDGEPKMDIREAIAALTVATEDKDNNVRAWAAHALAEIGPDAKPAVPALIKLLSDPDEGPRNDSCMALGDIGPAARDALPALRKALNDPSKDVRRFAKHAIEKIESE